MLGLVEALASGPVAAREAPALPALPHAVSSLGAVECDGYLYVYGGHAGKTHTYSTKDVLGTFHRIKLDGGAKWEELPGGPILQGMNLAAHGGKVYRVGGMRPRNEPGQPCSRHHPGRASFSLARPHSPYPESSPGSDEGSGRPTSATDTSCRSQQRKAEIRMNRWGSCVVEHSNTW